VSRRYLEYIPGAQLERGSVLEDHACSPGQQRADVARLAPIPAHLRLDMRGPAPTGLVNDTGDGEPGDLNDLGLEAGELDQLVGFVEILV
jgi:hypothetical protein